MSDFIRERKFGDLANSQCPTIFKISGHQCLGTYGHTGICQDIGYPDKISKDVEVFHV